jgi:hypothetical protein
MMRRRYRNEDDEANWFPQAAGSRCLTIVA